MLVRLIVRRLIFLVFVLFGLSLITFGLSHIIPGDPARLMAGPRAGKSAVDKIREQYGLNDPLPAQYVTYVRNLAQGDLGTSFTTRRPVSDDLKRYLPATIELRRHRLRHVDADRDSSGNPLLRSARQAARPLRAVRLHLGSCPAGLLAGDHGPVRVLRTAGLAPDGARIPIGTDPPPTVTGLYTIDSLIAGDWELFRLSLVHLIMPATVLAYGSLAVITRMVRGGMLEVLNQDYIRTARAKGITPRTVSSSAMRSRTPCYRQSRRSASRSDCSCRVHSWSRSSSPGPVSAGTPSRPSNGSITTRRWRRHW